ncbi:MAG TPA: CRISPR-associated endonuclease Cas2 [Candidatus Blautia faecipullorum]|nr:CRISPR-associated endonuclease Cas2 [Candidatus Blautia faecipullorum]
MYVILTYDIQQKRVAKVHKVCKKYLAHIQRSVFVGNISEAKLNNLKRELFLLISPQYDSVIIYRLDSVKYAVKEQLGMVQPLSNII